MSKQLHLEQQEEELASQETGLSIEVGNLLYSNKAWRTTLAQSVVDQVAHGDLDATKTLIQAKKGIELLTAIEKNIRPYVAGKQIQKGGIIMYDSVITEKKDADEWDFKACEDDQWTKLQSELECVKEAIKNRETFLKTLKEDLVIVDKETGDIITIHTPIQTFGKQNISVSLK